MKVDLAMLYDGLAVPLLRMRGMLLVEGLVAAVVAAVFVGVVVYRRVVDRIDDRKTGRHAVPVRDRYRPGRHRLGLVEEPYRTGAFAIGVPTGSERAAEDELVGAAV